MKRKWIYAGVLAGALTGLGGLAYATSDHDGHRGPAQMRGERTQDFGWSGQRWRDEDRYERRSRDEDRRGEGRRFRDDDDGYRGHRGQGGRHGMGHRHDRHGEHMQGHRHGEHMHGQRGHRHGEGYGRPSAADPAALDGLKRELNITTAQEEAWSKYAAALKDAAEERNKAREAMRAGVARNLSVEEHRQFRDQMIGQRQKEIAAVRDAADALVKTLDEKQVATAREVLPGYAIGRGGMGMGRMGMGGMGMGMGPGHRH